MWTNSLPPGLLNTVHCMDCLEFMKTLPDGCVDLVLTDPPYWIWMSKWTFLVNTEKKITWKRKFESHTRDDFIPSKEVFNEILRISKNQIIFWWNYFIEHLHNSRCWIVREKKEDYRQWSNFADCELARTSFDENIRLYKFWVIWFDWLNNPQKEDKVHPTQKPVPLFKRILENYSEQWMTVLDCFAWSWTTGVACKELGRNYILVEKEPKYCDIIHKRLQNTTVSLFHS